MNIVDAYCEMLDGGAVTKEGLNRDFAVAKEFENGDVEFYLCCVWNNGGIYVYRLLDFFGGEVAFKQIFPSFDIERVLKPAIKHYFVPYEASLR